MKTFKQRPRQMGKVVSSARLARMRASEARHSRLYTEASAEIVRKERRISHALRNVSVITGVAGPSQYKGVLEY